MNPQNIVRRTEVHTADPAHVSAKKKFSPGKGMTNKKSAGLHAGVHYFEHGKDDLEDFDMSVGMINGEAIKAIVHPYENLGSATLEQDGSPKRDDAAAADQRRATTGDRGTEKSIIL